MKNLTSFDISLFVKSIETYFWQHASRTLKSAFNFRPVFTLKFIYPNNIDWG